jgi:hypothetical protein
MMKREGEKKDYAPPFEATTLALLPLESTTIAKLLQDTSATTPPPPPTFRRRPKGWKKSFNNRVVKLSVSIQKPN